MEFDVVIIHTDPVRGFTTKNFAGIDRAVVQYRTSCSAHSATGALSLQCLLPITLATQVLQQRSTSAASLSPDAFPKRVVRRTKKKDTEERSQVKITLVPCSQFVLMSLCSIYETV